MKVQLMPTHKFLDMYLSETDSSYPYYHDAIKTLATDFAINSVCRETDIDLYPYLFVISQQSPRRLRTFTSYFRSLLDKADMTEHHSVKCDDSPLHQLVKISALDVDFMLAFKACVQYYFL